MEFTQLAVGDLQVGGACDATHNPFSGLRESCLLSATLLGIFTSDVHTIFRLHALEPSVFSSNLMQLSDLLYGSCLKGSSLEHLQTVWGLLQSMKDISVLKSRGTVVAKGSVSSLAVTCNALPNQMQTCNCFSVTLPQA